MFQTHNTASSPRDPNKQSSVPFGLNWKDASLPWNCSTSWSTEEEEDDDDHHAGITLPLSRDRLSSNRSPTSRSRLCHVSEEYALEWAHSASTLVCSKHTTFADGCTERAFLDTLAHRTTPLTCLKFEHCIPFRWHTPEQVFSVLHRVDRVILSNLHFFKKLPVPWQVRHLELHDCWFQEQFPMPTDCRFSSFRVSGGFGLDSESTALSYVLQVLKQHATTDFGYVVDHWGTSASSLLLDWVQCNPQLRHLELGTDVLTCFTQSQWQQWMTALVHLSLDTLTLHVSHRYDEERALILRDMLKQNRRIHQVRFVGPSQHIWMHSIFSICAWNRFANGVTALSGAPDREALLGIIIQRSHQDSRRLAYLFSQHTDTLCRWLLNCPDPRKRRMPSLQRERKKKKIVTTYPKMSTNIGLTSKVIIDTEITSELS